MIPVSLLAVVLLPLAGAGAMGVGFALMAHVQAGDAFWRTDLMEISVFAGSAIGGAYGVTALWVAVVSAPDQLQDTPLVWWLTVLGLAVGATTVAGWLASEYWPWTNVALTYPLVAASIVASYRLPLLIISRLRPTTEIL